MSKLQEIKDQVARDYGWSSYASSCGRRDFTDEIARRYAKAVAEDALKRASERATTKQGEHSDGSPSPIRVVDRWSIKSTPINTDL